MTDAAKDTKADTPKADAPEAEAPKADAVQAEDAKASTEAAPEAPAAEAEGSEAKAGKAKDGKAKDAEAKAGEAKAAEAKDGEAKDAEAAPKPAAPPKKIDISKLVVDEEVTCWCGKCKTFRPHTVKALQPPKPPKSVCLTCRAVHQVRLVEPGTKKARADGPAMPDVAPWPELVIGVNPDDATRYAITGNYHVEDFVMHKLFGLGKVVQIGTTQRARISFEAGIKWMLQNHQA